jgi:hypothetical protein
MKKWKVQKETAFQEKESLIQELIELLLLNRGISLPDLILLLPNMSALIPRS